MQETPIKTIKNSNPFGRVWRFYVSGFKNMSGTGRVLWLIILVKLFIMFAILRAFFFPNFLRQQAQDRDGRAKYVQEQLVDRKIKR
ncbi:DUF4492 domain-containing protein [Porphyromonas macacae]|uniref:DUF4492 domain-containing protein n=1 Tax=Porphyromonas macacae TaxID=28115 RepID=UPI0006892521|nr:DUF4492 domain-containing protein [Porphyromonas macacae]